MNELEYWRMRYAEHTKEGVIGPAPVPFSFEHTYLIFWANVFKRIMELEIKYG